jgi:hypothetical protein
LKAEWMLPCRGGNTRQFVGASWYVGFYQKGARAARAPDPEHQSKKPPSAMTFPSSPTSWSQDGPPAAAPGLPRQAGPALEFRNLLGIALPPGPVGQPAIPVDPATIALRFTVGPVEVSLEIAKHGGEQFAENARRQLRRRQRSAVGSRYPPWLDFGYGTRYKFGPTHPAQVAGYPGLARVITVKARRRERRLIQMYAIVGPYAMTLRVPEAQAAHELGPVTLYPAKPPVITPVVRMSWSSCHPTDQMSETETPKRETGSEQG